MTHGSHRPVVTGYADFYNTHYIKQYGAGERRVLQWLVQAAAKKRVAAVTEPYYDVRKDVSDALDFHGDPKLRRFMPHADVNRSCSGDSAT